MSSPASACRRFCGWRRAPGVATPDDRERGVPSSGRGRVKSPAFLNCLGKADIILLCETWCDESVDVTLDGYTCLQFSRTLLNANDTGSGGLCVYSNNKMEYSIDMLKHDSDNYVWLKVCSSHYTYLICFMYVAPEGSPYCCVNRIWEAISDDIIDFSGQFGDDVGIVLCGDMNGRTGISPDYIEDEVNDRVPFPVYYDRDVEWPRYSSEKL